MSYIALRYIFTLYYIIIYSTIRGETGQSVRNFYYCFGYDVIVIILAYTTRLPSYKRLTLLHCSQMAWWLMQVPLSESPFQRAANDPEQRNSHITYARAQYLIFLLF